MRGKIKPAVIAVAILDVVPDISEHRLMNAVATVERRLKNWGHVTYAPHGFRIRFTRSKDGKHFQSNVKAIKE